MPKDKTTRKARNELPLEKRFQIVEEYENSNGLTGIRKLAEKFGCGKTTGLKKELELMEMNTLGNGLLHLRCEEIYI